MRRIRCTRRSPWLLVVGVDVSVVAAGLVCEGLVVSGLFEDDGCAVGGFDGFVLGDS